MKQGQVQHSYLYKTVKSIVKSQNKPKIKVRSKEQFTSCMSNELKCTSHTISSKNNILLLCSHFVLSKLTVEFELLVLQHCREYRQIGRLGSSASTRRQQLR